MKLKEILILSSILLFNNNSFAQQTTQAAATVQAAPAAPAAVAPAAELVAAPAIAPTAANLIPGKELIAAAIANKASLFAVGQNPVFGDILNSTIVVFYDYNCKFSRDLFPILKTITDKAALAKRNYRIIYRPIGMLADSSRQVAELALAVYAKDNSKFLAFHNALIASAVNPIGLNDLKTIVSTIPELNYDELMGLVTSKELSSTILQNQVVYDDIRMPGVPSMILAKLDGNNNIINDRIFYVAGTDLNQIEYNLYKLTM